MKIKTYLCLRFPKYKLRCILRALNLEPRPWQIDYALERDNWLPPAVERCNGKTVAVMLRMLMQHPDAPDVANILRADPDYGPEFQRARWYRSEYKRLAFKCQLAGIPVPNVFRHPYS